MDSTTHLGSAIKLVKVGGELVAVSHAMAKTGYKADNAYGAKSVFTGETTKGFYDKKVVAGSSAGKKLMPYYPNAQRNRPPETQRNLPKYRFGIPPPLSLYESYRGQSHMAFSSATPTGDVWKTTNQVFSECAQYTDTVGLANQGISSDIARQLHLKQQR